MNRWRRLRRAVQLVCLLGFLALFVATEYRGEDRLSWPVSLLFRIDPLALLADLSATLGTDAVDVADFDRAGGLLRFRVARDGVLIAEDRAGAWQEARLRATAFWCDAEPVLRRAYEERLARIGRTES